MASDNSDDDISLTPSSPDKTTMQHGSPETWSRSDLDQDSDIASDGNTSPIERKGGQGRTYSYMSPISSDVDDILEKPQRIERMNSSHQEKPNRRRSFKMTERWSDIGTVDSETELEDHASEVSQKIRGQARKQVSKSPKGTQQESRNRKRGGASGGKSISHVSTENDYDSLPESIPTSRESKRKCRVSTENLKQIDVYLTDSDNSSASDCVMSEFEDSKDSVEHQARNGAKHSQHRHSDSAFSDNAEYVKEKPKKQRARVAPKRKEQALKLLSDHQEKPSEGSSLNPQVKKKVKRRTHNSFPIECQLCGRSIRCQAILERHMLTHTGEKPFECDECGKHYTSSSNLRIHQLSHSGKMDYACNECGQKFTHLPYLKRHLMRHSGKKMHICEHCGKGFIQKYHLLRHILVHTKQTPHVCDKCGMSFNRTDYLKVHLRNVHLIETNTDKMSLEKVNKCETCDKRFANATSLEIHKRIHTGAKPYSCTICSRQFKQSSHLYSHMITHSSEKPHMCDICELKFTRKNYLRKHKEKVHGVATDP